MGSEKHKGRGGKDGGGGGEVKETSKLVACDSVIITVTVKALTLHHLSVVQITQSSVVTLDNVIQYLVLQYCDHNCIN